MTVFLYTFTEREKIYNLCEALTGARFTTSLHAHRRRFARHCRPAGSRSCRKFLNEVVVNIDEIETLLTRNRIFVDRTQDVGVIPKDGAIDYGLTGPNLRGSGVEHDLRKAHPYLGYEEFEFDVPVGERRRLLRPLPRAHGGNAPERAHRPPVPRQTARRPDQRRPTGKIVLPPKDRVLTRMEELIHHFINVTQGRQRAAGRNLFRRTRIRRANWAFTSTARAAARRTG